MGLAMTILMVAMMALMVGAIAWVRSRPVARDCGAHSVAGLSGTDASTTDGQPVNLRRAGTETSAASCPAWRERITFRLA
jgi:hypothetical protein